MPWPNADRAPDEKWELDYATVAVAFGGDLAVVGAVAREVVRQREIVDLLWTGRYVETAHRTALVTLERIGGAQREIAARVAALLEAPGIRREGSAHLLVDITRVGTAALGAFRERGLSPKAVAVGAGLGDLATRVPWEEIVGVLRTQMQADRFRVAPELPMAGPFRTRLIRELRLAVDALTPGPPDPVLVAGGLPLWSIETRVPLLVA